MENTKPDKRLIKGEQMRQAILMAAIEIISTEGIVQVSAAKIAALIGTSKSNVFHHFKTREAIIIGVYDYICEGFDAAFSIADTDFRGYLLKLGEVLFASEEEAQMYKAFYAFYNEGLFVETFKERLKESTTVMIHGIEQQIAQILGNSGKASDDLDHRIKVVALGILCFLDGAGLHHMLNPNLEHLKEAWLLQIDAWNHYLTNKNREVPHL